jgi:hypothetical protein
MLWQEFILLDINKGFSTEQLRRNYMWYLQSQYYHFLPRGGDGNRKCLNPPQIQIIGNTLFCLGRDIELTAENIAPGQEIGNTFFWTGPNGYTSNASQIIYPAPLSGGNYIFTITVTNASGCSETINYEVEITFLSLSLSVDSIVLESSQSVGDGQIIASGSGGYTSGDYTYNIEMDEPIFEDPTYSQTNNTGIFTGSFTYNQVFKISISDEAGCQVTAQINTEQSCSGNPPIVSEPNLSTAYACSGSTIGNGSTLMEFFDEAIPFPDPQDGTWTITIGNNPPQSMNPPGGPFNPNWYYDISAADVNNVPGEYTVTVQVTNTGLCTDSTEFTLYVYAPVTVDPNEVVTTSETSPGANDGTVTFDLEGGDPLFSSYSISLYDVFNDVFIAFAFPSPPLPQEISFTNLPIVSGRTYILGYFTAECNVLGNTIEIIAP